MWIFTKIGFFSAVRTKDRKQIQVRARVKKHLEDLIVKAGWDDVQVITTHDSDYEYRVVVHPDDWTFACDLLASEIDYDNFKNACVAIPQRKLLAVWRAML